jgi:esterase/lipase superfamily enzyme
MQTVRLTLIVEGPDPGDHVARLGALMALRIVWEGRAEHVYAEPYDAVFCAAAREQHTVHMTLTEADLTALRTVRGPDEETGLFTSIANRIRRSVSREATTGRDDEQPYKLVRVFFATNRKDTNDADTAKRFGIGRSTSVTYGAVAVAIPNDHRLGHLETPSIFKLELRKDPARHVSLESIEVLSKEQWSGEVQQRATHMGKPGVLLFIHGYNVSFSDAAERAGQLAYDLAFPGPTVFFSWPSQGGLAQYTIDGQMAEYSVVDMKVLLADLAAMVPGGPVYVIAHSMGNRVLTRGFADLIATDPGKRRSFREIVLTAPDIDVDVFKRELAPKILVPGPRFTLYANSNDRALQVSDIVNGAWRLGQGGERITILRGVDSVDASPVRTDFLSHSYFGDTETLLSDLFYLIRESKPVEQRFRLESVTSSDGKYWRFKR